MIEITKACTAAFMKARNSLVVGCREKCVNWKKKQKILKKYFYIKYIFIIIHIC